MSKIVVELRKKLQKKKAEYHAKGDAMTVAGAREASDEIDALTKTIAAAIADGAKPCPFCEQPVTGIEHQGKREGSFEYEVGCTACPAFEHTDGTKRRPAARGGVLPRHTVELWNEGPDYWIVAKPESAFATPVIGKVDDAKPAAEEGGAS